jgi:effector-binding domain-containing protein
MLPPLSREYQCYRVEERDLLPQRIAVVARLMNRSDVSRHIGPMLEYVAAELTRQGMGPVGPPHARYHRSGDGSVRVEAGFPCVYSYAGTLDVYAIDVPGAYGAVTWHLGPRDSVLPAYQALASWIDAEGYEPLGDPWEVYITDPKVVLEPDKWQTELIQPFLHYTQR